MDLGKEIIIFSVKITKINLFCCVPVVTLMAIMPEKEEWKSFNLFFLLI